MNFAWPCSAEPGTQGILIESLVQCKQGFPNLLLGRRGFFILFLSTSEVWSLPACACVCTFLCMCVHACACVYVLVCMFKWQTPCIPSAFGVGKAGCDRRSEVSLRRSRSPSCILYTGTSTSQLVCCLP